MNRKLLLSILLLLGYVIVSPQSVSAHVLISDSTKSIGAVLHVMPDDDPVAGQTSNLFFEVQTQKINKDTAKLTVTDNSTGVTTEIPIKINGSSVSAGYTFPTQGVYNFLLTVSSDKTYTFNHSQRVSRGVTGSALDKPTYPLANLALVFCGTAFLFLLIILFNHRKEMWRHSTF